MTNQINRLASVEQANEILAAVKARKEDYHAHKYMSYFDSAIQGIMNDRIETFINILDTDYNGTGYLDGLATAELPGDVGKTFMGIDKHGRRVLVVKGVDNNNIVLFERYTPKSGTPAVVVKNCGGLYRPFLPSGRVNEEAFFHALDLVQDLQDYVKAVTK